MRDTLTPSEQRIYRLIVEQGASNKEIAACLKRNLNGTKSDVERIRDKLGIKSRAKMIVSYWKEKAK